MSDVASSGVQSEAALEILRRSTGVDGLPAEAFGELSAEVFRGYDAEEPALATNTAR